MLHRPCQLVFSCRFALKATGSHQGQLSEHGYADVSGDVLAQTQVGVNPFNMHTIFGEDKGHVLLKNKLNIENCSVNKFELLPRKWPLKYENTIAASNGLSIGKHQRCRVPFSSAYVLGTFHARVLTY